MQEDLEKYHELARVITAIRAPESDLIKTDQWLTENSEFVERVLGKDRWLALMNGDFFKHDIRDRATELTWDDFYTEEQFILQHSVVVARKLLAGDISELENLRMIDINYNTSIVTNPAWKNAMSDIRDLSSALECESASQSVFEDKGEPYPYEVKYPTSESAMAAAKPLAQTLIDSCDNLSLYNKPVEQNKASGYSR